MVGGSCDSKYRGSAAAGMLVKGMIGLLAGCLLVGGVLLVVSIWFRDSMEWLLDWLVLSPLLVALLVTIFWADSRIPLDWKRWSFAIPIAVVSTFLLLGYVFLVMVLSLFHYPRAGLSCSLAMPVGTNKGVNRLRGGGPRRGLGEDRVLRQFRIARRSGLAD